MARAAGIIKRINRALTGASANDMTVFKRRVTHTGGDALIGRFGTSTNSDTLLVPQPLYNRLGRNVVGNAAPSQGVLADDNSRIAVDYQILFSSTAITTDELNDELLLIVMKDAEGFENIYHLTDYEPVALNGVDLLYIAYIRSAART